MVHQQPVDNCGIGLCAANQEKYFCIVAKAACLDNLALGACCVVVGAIPYRMLIVSLDKALQHLAVSALHVISVEMYHNSIVTKT